MSIVSRPYEGHADLARMVELEKEIAAARWPELPRWHAGDVVWNAYILDAGSDCARLWFDGEAPIAYGLLASPDEIQVAVRPRLANDDALFNRIMEWAESTVQAWVGPGAGATVGILVKERDSDLTRQVAARGYVRQDHGGTFLRRSLQTAIGEQPLPPGMRVIDCIDVDLEERAAAHRDAWSHLEHLGMGAVRSSFTTERYRRLRDSRLRRRSRPGRRAP